MESNVSASCLLLCLYVTSHQEKNLALQGKLSETRDYRKHVTSHDATILICSVTLTGANKSVIFLFFWTFDDTHSFCLSAELVIR